MDFDRSGCGQALRRQTCLGKSPLRNYRIIEEEDMPFVNIKILRSGVTREQKEKLIQGTTQVLVDVLGKNPANTVIVIDEVDSDNWGMGGESVTTRRERG
jgi:4-oxalocrotonate tautomerase